MNSLEDHPITERVQSELTQIAEATPVRDDMWLRIMEASNVADARSGASSGSLRWRLVAIGATCAATVAIVGAVVLAAPGDEPAQRSIRSANTPDCEFVTSTPAPGVVDGLPTPQPEPVPAPAAAPGDEPAQRSIRSANAPDCEFGSPATTAPGVVDDLPTPEPQPAPLPAPEPPVTTIVVEPTDPSALSVSLAVGERTVISIQSPEGDGGYAWSIEGAPDGGIAAVEAAYATPACDVGPADGACAPGAPVPYLVTITGVAPGTTNLSLVQRRVFGPKDVIAMRTYSITVR